MGFKDLFIMFKTDTSKKFKFSVILSIVLYIAMIFIFFHGYLKIKQLFTYSLLTHLVILGVLFVIGLIAFIVRNYSKHKFLKGTFFIILKLFVLIVFFFLLYIIGFQLWIFPRLYVTRSVFEMATMVSLTFIKLILG